jgi:hypothetical protein
MKKAILAAAVAALVVASCGSDDDSVQDQAANDLIANAEAEGIALDEGCVNDVASELSDADAEKLVGLGLNGDIEQADLSPEGLQAALGVLGCVDISSIIDEAIEDLRASGTEFDEQCVRDAFEGIDLSEAAGGELPDDVFTNVLACVEIGG